MKVKWLKANVGREAGQIEELREDHSATKVWMDCGWIERVGPKTTTHSAVSAPPKTRAVKPPKARKPRE